MEKANLLRGLYPVPILGSVSAVLRRRRSYRFQVSLLLDELAHVPLVNGVLFCKVRLLDGSYKHESMRKEVHRNSVRWNKTLDFECRIGRNPWTGTLQDCVCRVSVCKASTAPGLWVQSMGFADINLSEFAGSGFQIHHSILEMYDSRANKPDNSILKVGLGTSQYSAY
ncbi:UNVERIFIED_CONTAM: hypothetical protein FKN15_060222 [Acipenser sinensis]